MNAGRNEPVLLWPQGAPLARGNGPEDRPRLTLYLPEGAGPFACVVICPGGGYAGRAAHEAGPIAEWLNGIGVAGAVADYRVSPYRHPVPLGDAQRAIRLVRHHAAEWRIDPDRVGILGFSAGGHCAASAATIFDPGRTGVDDPVEGQSCRPDFLVACYPVITFSRYGHRGSMINLLADAEGKVDPALQEQLSLENRVTAQTPPAFLWHTADDAAVPVANSLLFAEALYRCGVPFELHVFPKGRHGLGLAADDPVVGQWTTLCARWLQTLGCGTGPRSRG